ncbi:HU family DNA-binding protein [Pelomonas sp. APW6]|uniref:HU family DNA-binding protein n=1 Tax=Roseateles subflavus TaxID=3053353 RepID=A0ABT7LSE5_9BURK|nr:HU family DNA-binding protein [Pelomonas sp. APW6]MDL5034376.1 HU family DNA-binding protein [Pelomonas sp. APW6]
MSKSLLMRVLKRHLPARHPSELTALAESIFDAFTEELAVTGKLNLPGTGSLRVKRRAARHGRSPSSGAVIFIPEKLVVRFAPAGRLTRVLQVVAEKCQVDEDD